MSSQLSLVLEVQHGTQAAFQAVYQAALGPTGDACFTFIGLDSFLRRHLFRSAFATAFFASACKVDQQQSFHVAGCICKGLHKYF